MGIAAYLCAQSRTRDTSGVFVTGTPRVVTHPEAAITYRKILKARGTQIIPLQQVTLILTQGPLARDRQDTHRHPSTPRRAARRD